MEVMNEVEGDDRVAGEEGRGHGGRGLGKEGRGKARTRKKGRDKGKEGRRRGRGEESNGAGGKKARVGGHGHGRTGLGVEALPLTSGSFNDPSSKRLLEERSHTHFIYEGRKRGVGGRKQKRRTLGNKKKGRRKDGRRKKEAGMGRGRNGRRREDNVSVKEMTRERAFYSSMKAITICISCFPSLMRQAL